MTPKNESAETTQDGDASKKPRRLRDSATDHDKEAERNNHADWMLRPKTKAGTSERYNVEDIWLRIARAAVAALETIAVCTTGQHSHFDQLQI